MGSTCLRLSELPGLVYLFFFTGLVKFSVMISSLLSLFSFWYYHGAFLHCYISCCPKCFLSSLIFENSFFFLLLFLGVFFSILSSKTLIRSSISSFLLSIPSSVLFISDIAFFIYNWSFFMVSISFSMLLSILIIIPLNSLSDKLLASVSSISYSGEFSCSFVCGLFLYLPILAVSLYLFLNIR